MKEKKYVHLWPVRMESGGVVQSYGIRWKTENVGDGTKGWMMSEGQTDRE